MIRSDETLFDPRIASWLEADPNTAPEPVLEVVLAALPAIKQRRVWRVPLVPALPRTQLAQATLIGVVLLAVAVGFGIWSGGRDLVVPPGASPTQSPSPSFEAPTQSPSPTPSPSPSLEARTYPPTGTGDSIHGWPDTNENPPGVYSWDGYSCAGGYCKYGFMHNGYGSGNLEMRVVTVPGGVSSDGATAVRVAGHDGNYRQVGTQWQEWTVEIDGTTIAIRLQAHPQTSPAELAEAHAIVESMTYESRDNDLGFRLLFTLTTDDWDSG